MMAEILSLPLLQFNLIERKLFAALDYTVYIQLNEVEEKGESLCKQI